MTSVAEIQTFEPEGRAIPYADEPRNGPAVVLLPGEGLNISYLGPLAESLVAEDFRVVRIGARRPGANELTLHDLAADVVDVMAHLGVAYAWVGGHGFGGALARAVSLDHVARVAGVLLMGVEGADPVDSHDSESSEIPERARDADVVAMQRAALAGTDDIGWSTLAPAVPVLIVQGTDDPITPPANGAALQASAPDRVSVVPVEGGGHLFPLTHVGATSWAIEDYLDWD